MSQKKPLYPIQCQLTSKASSLVVHIIKVGRTGFLINSELQPLKVNDTYVATFVLPHNSAFIECQVVVYKTYDEFKGSHGLVNPGHHVNELVVKNPTPDIRKNLNSFVAYAQTIEQPR